MSTLQQDPPPPFELHFACASGASASASTIECVLQADPDALTRPDRPGGMTPLHHACASGASVEVIRALLDAATADMMESIPGGRGAELMLERKDRRGRTPLHCACQFGKAPFEVIELIVDACPSSPGMVDLSLRTPLHYACCHGALMGAIIHLLVERHPDAVVSGRGSATPLHTLCRHCGGPTDLVQLLTDTKPEAAAWWDLEGRTPLVHALLKSAPLGTVRVLADTMCSVKGGDNEESSSRALLEKDMSGRTPLHFACSVGGPVGSAMFLFDRCPKAVQERDREGRTPLEAASPQLRSLMMQYEDWLKLELDSNAEPSREFFEECCKVEWWGGAWERIRKQPPLVHFLNLEAVLMPVVLSKVGQSFELGVMWEIMKGAPSVVAFV